MNWLSTGRIVFYDFLHNAVAGLAELALVEYTKRNPYVPTHADSDTIGECPVQSVHVCSAIAL